MSLKRYIKPLAILGFDGFIAALSLWIALYLRYDFKLPAFAIPSFWLYSILYALICMTFYFALKLHRTLWQYSTARDLVRLAYGTFFSVFVAASLLLIITRFHHFPRSAFFIVPLIQIAISSSPRVFFRLWHDKVFQTALQPKYKKNNVLLIGVGDMADLFVRECSRQAKSPYNIVAALDDDRSQHGRIFHHVVVKGAFSDAIKVLHELEKKGLKVDTFVIANLIGEKLKTVLELANSMGITVKRIPSISNLKDGAKLTDLKPVMIEDLLGRDCVKLNNSSIQKLLENQVVLVTGAGGSIGSELCRQIASYEPQTIVLLDHSEDALYQIDMEFSKAFPKVERQTVLVDIKNKEDILKTLQTYKPSIIFHAAAYKHVPMIEANPISGIENNLFGTKNLLDCAVNCEIPRMVMVSTDKAVNPTNVMGATKRAAEMYALSLCEGTKTAVMAVRFGNVLGSNGSVIPLFRKQIIEGGPLTVTHEDAERYFMTIPEAAGLILQAAAKGESGNLFMLDMGESVKIVHLAEEMIRLSGLEPYKDIDIQITGLRPGEKLFEELWYDCEQMSKTDMEKTFLVCPHTLSKEETVEKVDAIYQNCLTENAFNAVQTLKALVKEYQPAKNSPYAALNDLENTKKGNENDTKSA